MVHIFHHGPTGHRSLDMAQTRPIARGGAQGKSLQESSAVLTLPQVDKVRIGGASVARLDIEQTARLMLDLALGPAREAGPFYFTSANGEVLARRFLDAEFALLVDRADLISADGQPLVLASRLFANARLPERVASTDLFPAVACGAERRGVSFYLLGATEAINRAACDAIQRDYPGLDLRGASHGYLAGPALDRKVDEINRLSPHILWLALGVPLEQQFVDRYASRLSNIRVIKTAGGLFDFVSGAKPRAPAWMQHSGLEWAFRLGLEPRRLLRRYLTTNPIAAFLLLTQTGRTTHEAAGRSPAPPGLKSSS